MRVTLPIFIFALLILIFLCGCEKLTGPKKDTTPPAAIPDLRIVTNTDEPITLTWTAPGDDGNKGTAAWYFIRYCTDSTIIAGWDFANCVLDKPTPKPAGTKEEFVLGDLSVDSNYYFAIRTQDDAGNLSGLSNIASGSPIAGAGIVFESYGQIYVVNSDGSHVKMVSRNGASHWDPAWSYDRRIVFASGSDIYLVDTDGWHQHRLTTVSGWVCSRPLISPDGSKILFQAMDYWPPRQDSCDIYVMFSDGSYLKNLTEKGGPRDYDPAWSPDGRKIAFASRRDYDFEIYVMNWDGSNLHRLTNYEGTDRFPMWSPYGTKILYTSCYWEAGDQHCDVCVMNSDGTDQRALTSGGRSAYAVWSPDGTKIAYESLDGDIYVMNSNGSNKKQLTTDPGYEGKLTWSPDGTKIAFVTDREGYERIYVMNADGTGQKKVSDRMIWESYPVWSALHTPHHREW